MLRLTWATSENSYPTVKLFQDELFAQAFALKYNDAKYVLDNMPATAAFLQEVDDGYIGRNSRVSGKRAEATTDI